MGFAVAEAAREAGAHVTIVTGPVQLPTPMGITRINVESARDMYAAVHRQVADADIFIAAAAVADFQPVTVAKQKIKKQGGLGQAGTRARAGHHQVGRRHGQAPFRGGLCRRNQRRRRECAHQAQAQEAGHDRRERGRRRHCIRLRGQCADGDLAGRQNGSGARTENRCGARTDRAHRQAPAAARWQSAARRAQAQNPRRAARPRAPRRARARIRMQRIPSSCGSWIRASAANFPCRSMRPQVRPGWICAPASTRR